MDLSPELRRALEAKIALIRRERDHAAQSATVAIKREMATRGLFGSGATLVRCWDAIRAGGLEAASATVKACVQVGARDAKAIHDYVTDDYACYLRSFDESSAQGSSNARLLETQLRSQAESEAARFYEEAQALLFDLGPREVPPLSVPLDYPHDNIRDMDDREQLTQDEIDYRVAKACMHVLAQPPKRNVRLQEVVNLASLPTALVRTTLIRMHVSFGTQDTMLVTQYAADEMQAVLEVQVKRHPTFQQTAYNTVNAQGGTGFNVAVGGGEVSGNTINITFGQMLAQLQERVEASDLPPEKKEEAAGHLKGLMGVLKSTGQTVLQAAVQAATKAALEGGGPFGP